MPTQKKTSAALAGLASGAAQVLAEQPLDTIKIRLQSRALVFDAFAGPASVAASALRNEGAGAFFRGLAPRLLTYAPVKSALFAQYDALSQHLPAPLAGAVAGGCNTVLSCPVDGLKSRLQVLRATTPDARWPAVARDMYARGAFYRGWRPLVCRDVPGYGLLFGVYDYGRNTTLPAPLVGAAAGVAFYSATLPIDRVKTVMMTQDIRRPAFASAAACARDILRRDGVAGFYRASAPTLLRTACGQAVALSVYELLR